MGRRWLIAAVLAVCAAAPAFAQDAEEAVVVTGTRLARQDFEAIQAMPMPHVTLRKRAYAKLAAQGVLGGRMQLAALLH